MQTIAPIDPGEILMNEFLEPLQVPVVSTPRGRILPWPR